MNKDSMISMFCFFMAVVAGVLCISLCMEGQILAPAALMMNTATFIMNGIIWYRKGDKK